MKKSVICVLAFAVCSVSGTGPAMADDSQEIRALIPAATAMTLRDFDKLATSPKAPSADDVEDKSLTLMLLALRAKEDEKAQAEFRYLTDRVPKPQNLAKEITRHVRGSGKFRFPLGPLTMVQADRITAFSCEVDGDKATGAVAFEVPKLYRGSVNYAAQRADGKWRITEFRMPAYELHIVRGASNKWLLR